MEEENVNEYDLFISHKQENGSQLAQIIKLLLEKINPHLNIFLDIDDLGNIHDLEKNVKNSENILLIITEGVFERRFVQLELQMALSNDKNIITLWDKEHYPIFPKKDDIEEKFHKILDIKAIIWNSEKMFKEAIIKEIILKIKFKNNLSIININNKDYLFTSYNNIYFKYNNDKNIKVKFTKQSLFGRYCNFMDSFNMFNFGNNGIFNENLARSYNLYHIYFIPSLIDTYKFKGEVFIILFPNKEIYNFIQNDELIKEYLTPDDLKYKLLKNSEEIYNLQWCYIIYSCIVGNVHIIICKEKEKNVNENMKRYIIHITKDLHS